MDAAQFSAMVAAARASQRRRLDRSGTPDAAMSTFTNATWAVTADGVATAALTYTARTVANATIADLAVDYAVSQQLVSASLSSTNAAPSTIENDGVDSTTVTLTVLNSNGDPVVGFPASACVLAVSGTGNTVTQPTGYTNYLGQISGSFVSTVSEVKTASWTVANLAITDTGSVTCGTPSPGVFPNEPSGFTSLGFWNDSATIDSDGWVEDGNPNAVTSGEKTVVSTGYTGTPTIGGTNVIRSSTAGGQPGGYDPGRMQLSGLTTYDDLFFGFEFQLPTGYPTSNNSGGNKIAIINFVNGATPGRYFLNFDTGGAGGNWDLYGGAHPLTSTLLQSSSTPVTYGDWVTVEFYLSKAGAAGSHIIRVWVDGALAIERTNLTFPPGEDFSYAVFDGSNNGNRIPPSVSPDPRYINNGVTNVDATMYISALYLSVP